MAAPEGDDAIRRFGELDGPEAHRRALTPQRDEGPDEGEHRRRILLLIIDSERMMPVIDREPGFDARKAAMRRIVPPRHGRAAAVAPETVGPEADAFRILQLLKGTSACGRPSSSP